MSRFIKCPQHGVGYYEGGQGCYVCGMDAMLARIEARRKPEPPTCTRCGAPGSFSGSYGGLDPRGQGLLFIREICRRCEATLKEYAASHRKEYEAYMAESKRRAAKSPYTRTPDF